MKKILIRTVISMVSIWLSAYFINGIIIDSISGLFISSVVFGFVNFFIKPVIKLLSVPVTLITLGLFIFVINGFVLLLTASFTPLYVDGLIPAIYGSVIISFSNWLLSVLLISRRGKK